jgi:hypothetical protein
MVQKFAQSGTEPDRFYISVNTELVAVEDFVKYFGRKK